MTVSYEEFKKNCNIENDDMIGAVFCVKNYKAIGHIDNDHSEWAIGYVYEEEVVENGYFFYPELKMQVVIDFQSLTKLQPKLQPLQIVINYNFLSFLY